MVLKTSLVLLAFIVVVSSSHQLCGLNEEWAEERRSCPPTCEFRNPPCIIETTQPPPGCTCKQGYIYLNSKRKMCVRISDCPKTCSEPRFIWNDCGTRCPITCFYPNPRPCVEICEPGCFCPKKYVLDDLINQCVKKKDCLVF